MMAVQIPRAVADHPWPAVARRAVVLLVIVRQEQLKRMPGIHLEMRDPGKMVVVPKHKARAEMVRPPGTMRVA